MNIKSTLTGLAVSLALCATAATAAMPDAPQNEWRRLRENPVSTSQLTPGRTIASYHARPCNFLKSTTARLEADTEGTAPLNNISQRPADQLRSPQNPVGELYAVVNRHSEMNYAHEAYMGQLSLSTGRLSKMYEGSVWCAQVADDYTLQANAYRNGQVICPTTAMYSLQNFAYYWDFVDLATGQTVDRVDFGPLAISSAYSMTWDSENDLIYFLGMNEDADSQLCVADPNNGYKLHQIGYIGQKGNIAAIAYNPKDKEIYAFDINNVLYTVNLENGDCRLVECGYLDSDNLFFQVGFAGQVCYSPRDEMFVCIYRDNILQTNVIYYFDPETLQVFEGQRVRTSNNTPFICSIFCTDAYALPDAPELAQEALFDFDKASLSGSMTVTAPEYTFAGVQITPATTIHLTAKIDGTVALEKDVKAGEQTVLPLTLAEGLHTLELSTAIGSNVSPLLTQDFYVGNDSPCAVTDLKIYDRTLTWTAPGAVGFHNGYVDTAALVYNVYINGVKQNEQPLTDCTFTLTPPAQMDVYDIEVEAVANNQASPKATLTKIFGAAFNLPFQMQPTRQESRLFTIDNYNRDGRIFFYTDKATTPDLQGTGDHYGMCFVTGYTEDADDWCILPVMEFPTADEMYAFEYDINGVYSAPTQESYEIWVGQEPSADAIIKNGICIFSDHEFMTKLQWEHKVANFAVPTAGRWYIALRVCSTRKQSAQGLFFHGFKVAARTGSSSVVPGEPEKIELKAAEFGDQKCTAYVTLPTKDLTGKALPADMDVTMTMTHKTYVKTATGKPGQDIELSLNTDDDGMASFTLTPSNANGSGYSRTYTLYVGVDIPVAPSNIKGITTADNLYFIMSWDTPTQGQNDGWLDPSQITYNLYQVTSSQAYKVASNITNTRVQITPFTNFDNPNKQGKYNFAPSAVNEAGESRNSATVGDVLGNPYELPMSEEYGYTKFDYLPCIFDTKNEFKMSTWENISGLDGMNLGDLQVAGGGAAMAFSKGGRCKARMSTPKITTAGIGKALFAPRVVDYKKGPKTFYIYGRYFGHDEWELIKTFQAKNPAKAEWLDLELPLEGAYLNAPWVQFGMAADLTGEDLEENFILDGYKVSLDADYDFKVTRLEGTTQLTCGQKAKYTATLVNAGRERQKGSLKIELRTKDGKTLAQAETAVSALNANQAFEYSAEFDIDGSMLHAGDLLAVATAECPEDDNTNNNVRELPVRMMGSELPVVHDLAAEKHEQGVRLSWSEPTNEFGNFETFEAVPAFKISEKLGMWGNYDLDGLKPVPIGAGSTEIKWPGSDQPQGWTVVDVNELGYMLDERFAPRSGNKVLLARTGQFETVETGQSDKWLTSPEVVPGSTVSFWMSSLSSQFKEYCEIWYSEKEPEFGEYNSAKNRNGTWRKHRSISKAGAEAWEFVQIELPAKAKYFAIRYTTYEGTAFLIDDIELTPAEMKKHTVDHYTLYRTDENGTTQAVAENLPATGHIDTTWPGFLSAYHVTSHADVNGVMTEGPKSNIVTIGESGVDDIDATLAVYAANGAIVVKGGEGLDISVAALDGKTLLRGTVPAQQYLFAVQPDIYLVTVNGRTYKLLVK